MKKLIVLAFLLNGCAHTPESVRQESSLVSGLTARSDVENGEGYTAKTTNWRSTADLPAAKFRVEALGNRFAHSRYFYGKFDKRNTLLARAREASLPGSYYSYDVGEESSTRNKLGAVRYVRLLNPQRQCVFMLQYWGTTATFEDAEQLLGSSRAEGWYCDETLSDSDVDNFLQGVAY